MKPISIRLSDEEIEVIDRKAKAYSMTRSDYIRYNLINETVQVIDRSKEFYQSLNTIYEAIYIVEQESGKTDLSAIREAVMNACRLLNL